MKWLKRIARRWLSCRYCDRTVFTGERIYKHPYAVKYYICHECYKESYFK